MKWVRNKFLDLGKNHLKIWGYYEGAHEGMEAWTSLGATVTISISVKRKFAMSRENDQTETSTEPVGTDSHKSSRGRKRLMVTGLVVLLLAMGAVLGLWFRNYRTSTSKKATTKTDSELALASKYVMENNMSQALAHAKKALTKTPNDLNTIQAVASLTEKSNPDEAKRYYAQALEVFKQQNNPDADGKTAITYWAAAGLAEKAGYKDQAKQYYQKVINAAKPSDSYEQNLVKRSQAALKALQ